MRFSLGPTCAEALKQAGSSEFVEGEEADAGEEEEEEEEEDADKAEDAEEDEDEEYGAQNDNQLISDIVYDGSVQPTPSADGRGHGALDALLAAAASNEGASGEQTSAKTDKPAKKKDDKVWIPAKRHVPLEEHRHWQQDTIKWVEKHMKDHKVTHAQVRVSLRVLNLGSV